MSELIKYAESILKEHGYFGDKSFEYIGVLLKNGIIYDRRLYLKNGAAVSQIITTTEPYKTMVKKIMHRFILREDVAICDISTIEIDEEPTYRMIFKLPKKQSIDELYELIGDFFYSYETHESLSYRERIISNILNFNAKSETKISPLMQIGIELNKNCELVAVKYYLRLEKANKKDIVMVEQAKQFLCSVVKGDNIGACISCASEKSIFISDNGYRPIFIGINDKNGAETHKIYFISKAFGFQVQNILKDTKTLSDTFAWNDSLPFYEFEQLYKLSLFVEGIALSVQHLDEWHLYFNILPRNTQKNLI